MSKIEKSYLGDGVYADYDGYGIILTTENGIDVLMQIYLEPSVMDRLDDYWKRRGGLNDE